MTIKSRTLAALENIGIPVYFGAWKPTATGETPPARYVTFTTMSTPAADSDDEISEWAHYVYLDLWSTGTYATQQTAIETAMNAAGYGISEQRDLYESDTGTYHLAMTWVYGEAV